MSTHLTLEERIALLETILHPTLDPDVDLCCAVNGCVHNPEPECDCEYDEDCDGSCESSEDVADFSAELESAIQDSIIALTDITETGTAAEIIAASGQLHRLFATLRGTA